MHKKQKHVGYFLHLYTYNLNILHICFFFLFFFCHILIWLPTVIILLRQNLSFSKAVFNLQQIELLNFFFFSYRTWQSIIRNLTYMRTWH